MRAVDFVILMLCCLGWAGNLVISSWALENNPVPPYMLAFIRSGIVLLLTFPFLRMKPPKHWIILLIVCACVGPVHLGFLYTGLQTTYCRQSTSPTFFIRIELTAKAK